MAAKEYVIIDTNVIHVACLAMEGEECIRQEYGDKLSKYEAEKCLEAVSSIESRILVLDCGDEIFNEYKESLINRQEVPHAISIKFLKWCWDYKDGGSFIDKVEITKVGTSYKEFPKGKNLKSFDDDDKKFIATANAHCKNPTILEATDVEWWDKKNDLKRANIFVKFLCEDYMKAMNQP